MKFNPAAEPNRVVFNFGRYRGRALEVVAQEEPGYLEWILGTDFFDDMKELVRKALFRFDEEE
jgi:DNA polymerase-3 subunit epsilon